MDCFTIIGFFVVAYFFIYTVALLFTDCDLKLALAQYFGRKLGKLKGKVVWITGASNGIGEAMAYCAASHGSKLVLSSRRINELEAVKQKCLKLNPKLVENDVLVLPLDVTKTETHEDSFERVIKHFGNLDILINNAGRSQRAIWENIDLEVDRQIFELNVFGVVNLSRIAVKFFNKKGKGQIAVTSSLAGIIGAPFSGSYTGTKHAIHGYFESLRTEKLGEKLHITLICPGPTFSEFLQESFTDKPEKKYGVSTSPTDRRMTAERCAYLSLTAIVNKLDEAWISVFPILPLVYVIKYFPNLFKLITKYFGSQQFQHLRDSNKVHTS